MATNDGSNNAPTGTPQLPNLLSSYGSNIPPWEVAGVNYYVGCPQALALKDPSTISMAGVTVNATTHIVTVTGNNITLSGYNFSLAGGWGVVIDGNNTTIANSSFVVGSNCNAPILGTQTSGNVTVTDCTLNGANNVNMGGAGLIEMRGTGTLVVDHSWLQNSPFDMVDMHNNGPSALVMQYNLIQTAGTAPGAHGDWTEFIGGPFTATIQYNTAIQTNGASQGFMVEPDLGSSPGVITGGEIGHNTMLGDVNTFTGITVADLTGQFLVDNNYFDPSQSSSGLAIGGVRGGPDDSSAYSVYAHNVNMTNGAVEQDSNAPATVTSTPPTQVGSTTTTTPSAPAIASWSPDTGVVGDGVTNVNTPTLKGSAAASSTVTVYDGSTKLGVATADSTGAWSFTTSKLSDGKHVLTATDTTSAGVSTASTALGITVDTHVPAAPVVSSDSVVNSNHVLISGTAEANSAIAVHDGTTLVGSATTSASGSWSLTTSALASGAHALTATATDAAGTTSAASAAVDPVISSTPKPPSAPTIASWSPDTGVVGDGVTNVNTPTLKGSAAASSTVTVYDGSTKLGVATADSTGAWSFTTSKLSDGTHVLTATDTTSAGVSTASTALGITVDTHVPAAPVETSDSVVNSNHVLISGTAEANSAIAVHDGTTLVGSATTNASGSWSLTTSALASGAHALTATATDAAGTTSAASAAMNPVIGSTAHSALNFTDLWGSGGVAALAGTADANARIQVSSNGSLVKTVTSDSSGHWSMKVGSLSNTIHTFTAQEVDSAGHVTTTASGAAILGTTGSDVLTSTGGSDVFFGKGSIDTFDFRPGFVHSIITDGGLDDHFTFSASEFTNFANLLSHATQVGADTVFSHGSDTLTLKNTKITDLHSADFHFA